jgi:hypothetical protein
VANERFYVSKSVTLQHNHVLENVRIAGRDVSKSVNYEKKDILKAPGMEG